MQISLIALLKHSLPAA